VTRRRHAAGWLALLAALALAACSSDDIEVGGRGEARVRLVQRADCPRIGVLADAADLTRFAPGKGEDLTGMVVDARVSGVRGQCDVVRNAVEVDLAITLDATRGPAADGRVLDVPYFVVVMDADGQVLDKQIYQARFEFEPNRSRARLSEESVKLSLPTAANLRGSAYNVSIGLQVNEAELAYNRRRGPR
jgi:hypothetical protein